MKRSILLGTLAGVGFLLNAASGALAAEMSADHTMPPPELVQFRPIEQPLTHKLAVTLGGLGLIGLELWWFLWSKPKSQRTADDDVEAVAIAADRPAD